jgi:tRNA(Arg) A34 adenosine deaminase TadA
MICFTQNNPIKTNTRAYRIGEQFNLPKYKEYPFVHAESHLISKLLDMYNTIDTNWGVVILRINRKGLILGSKPCINCEKLLNAVGLQNIYYSTDDGNFNDSIGNLTKVDELTTPMSMV